MDAIISNYGDRGVLGLTVLVLLYGVKKLFDLYCEAQEARIADAKVLTKSLDSSTDAIEASTRIVETQVAQLAQFKASLEARLGGPWNPS